MEAKRRKEITEDSFTYKSFLHARGKDLGNKKNAENQSEHSKADFGGTGRTFRRVCARRIENGIDDVNLWVRDELFFFLFL